MSKLNNLTGMRFGRLVALERAEDYVTPKGQHKTQWRCRCDCGNEIITNSSNLRSGITKSCGCFADEIRSQNGHNNKKHGGFGTRLYRIYRGMWQRCYDKKVSQYPRYGGRGISICDEWMGETGFERFREWSYANGYDDLLTIDRINNDGNYSPDNCRWCTQKEQQNNRMCNVLLTVDGETHTMAEWSDISGINVSTIKSRHNAGWNDYDIIHTPVDMRRATKKAV